MTDDKDRQVRTVEGEVLTPDADPSILEKLKELTVTTKVEAVKKGKQFFTVDRDLNPILAGYVQRLDFDQGKAKGLVFIEKESNQQYSLGNPGRRQTEFPVIHHHQVLRPIADAGFELADLVHNRGNAGVFALFQHPDIKIADSMTWDSEAYEGRGDGYMSLSIAAWLDARLGKSIRLAVGFFRSICYNGLVSAVLGLGHMRITHNQFSVPRIDQFAQNAIKNNQALEMATFSPRVLDWPLKMLDAYQRDGDAVIDSVPGFVSKPFLTSLGALPNWYQDEMLYQMNMARDSDKDLSTLDVLNMITNANHASETNNILFRIESISEAFVQLLEVAAFKQGVDFPSILTNVNR